MARTSMVVSSPSLNDGAAVTKTIMAAGATGLSGYSFTGIERDSDLRIFIENGGSATGVFSIKSGDYCNSSQGDLEEIIGVGVTKVFQIDGSRFGQDDATISVDAGTTGTAYAIQ